MISPEMVKMRDVVIISRHPHNPRLVTIVPLSASQPRCVEGYHYELAIDPRPNGDSMHPIWVKCDMIYTVSLDRLDMHYLSTRRGGRQVVPVKLSSEDMGAVMRCVAFSLGLV
jgi:uncharacterized protein YifN (PemK superfamily)